MTNPFEIIDSRLTRIEDALSVLASKSDSGTEKKYYSISDAAKKLHVAAVTIYRNAKAGKIPVKRIGSRLLIPSSYLDDPTP